MSDKNVMTEGLGAEIQFLSEQEKGQTDIFCETFVACERGGGVSGGRRGFLDVRRRKFKFGTPII